MALKLDKINSHKKFPLNGSGQDYFVGDIHGHHQLLLQQLAEVNFNFETDRLFAVGDLIDRGIASEKCIELLIEPWFHSVLGNHEHLFLQGFENNVCWQVLIENGGGWLENWLDSPSKLLAWAHLMRIKMPLAITVKTALGEIGITHADAPLNWKSLATTDISNIAPYIWQRQNFIAHNNAQDKTSICGIDVVFHGHNQVNTVKVINNQLWADTIQKTGRLSIMSANDIFDLIKNNKP